MDAAYAGNAFICPELKYLMAGIEYADSFNTNTNKFLLTNFDCSCLWVRDRFKLTGALVVDRSSLSSAHPRGHGHRLQVKLTRFAKLLSSF